MYILKEVKLLEDFEDFLKLKSQKDAVKWSGFTAPPERESFRKYFVDKILNNPSTHVFFLCDKDVEGCPVVGYRQYDEVSPIEIAIRGTTIKKSYQGTDAIEALNNLLTEHYKEKGYKKFSSWISEKNKASEYVNVMGGWTKTDEFEIIEVPLLGGPHKFFKWVKEIKG